MENTKNLGGVCLYYTSNESLIISILPFVIWYNFHITVTISICICIYVLWQVLCATKNTWRVFPDSVFSKRNWIIIDGIVKYFSSQNDNRKKNEGEERKRQLTLLNIMAPINILTGFSIW